MSTSPKSQPLFGSIFHAISVAVHDDDDSAVLSLPVSEAQSVIDELSRLLDMSPFLGGSTNFQAPSARNKLRKLSLKVSQRHDVLPTSLILGGVECTERDHRGGGGFADVYFGTYYRTPVALKRLRDYQTLSTPKRAELKKQFSRECLLWKSLRHDHILPFLGVSESAFEYAICMVLPWMENGSIRSYMNTLRERGMLADHNFVGSVLKWLHQISLGLDYLHEEGLVHGDLHGGNILIDSSGSVRLADFGLALIFQATPYGYGSIHGGGATRWKAPELIDPDEFGLTGSRPTLASDIYSFACVCIELYTENYPFSELLGDTQVSLRVLRGLRPSRPTLPNGDTMEDAMWYLTNSCWAHNLSKRPSSGEVSRKLADIVRLPRRSVPAMSPADSPEDPSPVLRHSLAQVRSQQGGQSMPPISTFLSRLPLSTSNPASSQDKASQSSISDPALTRQLPIQFRNSSLDTPTATRSPLEEYQVLKPLVAKDQRLFSRGVGSPSFTPIPREGFSLASWSANSASGTSPPARYQTFPRLQTSSTYHATAGGMTPSLAGSLGYGIGRQLQQGVPNNLAKLEQLLGQSPEDSPQPS